MNVFSTSALHKILVQIVIASFGKNICKLHKWHSMAISIFMENFDYWFPFFFRTSVILLCWDFADDFIHRLHSDLGPISLMLSHRNSNLMEILFWSHLDSNVVIATKFCSWHDSCTVMATFRCSLMANDWITAGQSFQWIQFARRQSLVKWVLIAQFHLYTFYSNLEGQCIKV